MNVTLITHKVTLDEHDSLDTVVKDYEAKGFVFMGCEQLMGAPGKPMRLREMTFTQSAQDRAAHERAQRLQAERGE